MSNFSDRLRSEIEYTGLSQKEFAAKAGVKKRALDMYLGAQHSMSPADTAVKLALALGVSVEYLVTGKQQKLDTRAIPKNSEFIDISQYTKFKDILDDLTVLPNKILIPTKKLIKAMAAKESPSGGG